MISRNSGIIIIQIFAVIAGFSACSSSLWVKHTPGLIGSSEIFDKTAVEGMGLKSGNNKYVQRSCIKESETSHAGGFLSIEFIDPEDIQSMGDGVYRDFVKKGRARASAYNITGKEPVSLACIIRVFDKRGYIIDNSIQFTDTAQSLLDKKDFIGFYRLCGTHFVDSTLFESSVIFFVSYYLPPDKADLFRAEIEYGRKFTAADIRNFSFFESAGEDTPVFFSVMSISDYLFIPHEFPLTAGYGIGIEDFINYAVQALLSSSSGQIGAIEYKKWTDLPDVNRYLPVDKKIMFMEEVHDQVEYLTQNMLDFEILKLNLPADLPDELGNKITELARSLNWADYYRCSWGIRYNGYLSPEQEADCSGLVTGLGSYSVLSRIPFYRVHDKYNSLNAESFRDIRLIDKSIIDNGEYGYIESDYRFNDKTLYGHVPETVYPGQTMDSKGRFFPNELIIKDSIHLISRENAGIGSVKNDAYPVDYIEWGFLKKIFFFWKKPPAGRYLYRGNLEVESYSDELSDDFMITEEAADLARRDLVKFFEKYGTHYVSQIKKRRGLVYYYSIGSDKDRDIKVEPYGISRSGPGPEEMDIPPDAVMPGCMSFLPGRLFRSDKKDKLLNPETVEDFFKDKKFFSAVLKDDKKSIPAELYLKPWSQYLVARGIIRIDQQIPVRLMRQGDKALEPWEGDASIVDHNGNLYKGMLSNGLKNGYGELKIRGGSEYRGTWMGNLMHGIGEYLHREGSVYRGDFYYGYPHGNGEYKDKNHNIYTGAIVRGMMTGKGRMEYRDGRFYKGDFLKGKPHGYGVMEYPDGRKIEGIYEEGQHYEK